MNTPTAVASESSDAVAADTAQGSDGGASTNLGPCPTDLASIIKSQATGPVTPLTSLDGTPDALVAALPSPPVCAVEITEVDRVGRYLFWQDGNLQGTADALNSGGYTGALKGDDDGYLGGFHSGSKVVYLTDQFGAGGGHLPVGSYVLGYRAR
ncbi:hypothetical protein [Microbacterium sp. NPDC086615]|uniref:hypothetical protein n=1 Tax=Microbacterium sp. NPDC086615 TaxID=3154865 RepID=UPI00343F3890